MLTKEEQQKAINEKRKLRKKQIAQLKASNEMLESVKANIVERYGDGSDTAESLLRDINIAKEQNLERAASYLGASKDEVESAQYDHVSQAEEKAYYDRLKRLGKNDENLHIKNLSELKEKKEANVAKTTKTKSKLSEITEKLKALNSKNKEQEPSETVVDTMDEIPPEEIIAPNAGDISLIPYNETFDSIPLEEFGKPLNDVESDKKQTEAKNEVKESVIEPTKIKRPSVIQKSCKDFDPRDIPSYIQYDIIPLPSRGECYAHKKSAIPVAYLTAADENLITSRNMYESGSMIDIILERKILDKSIRVADLCKGDRDAIAIWLRATAYGPDYPIIANYQENEIETTIDLSDIKFLDFNLVGDENGWFEYKIQNTGDILKFKVLTYGEENELVNKNNFIEDIVNRDNIVKYMDRSIEYVSGTTRSDKDEVVEAINLVKKWCLDINIDIKKELGTQYSTYITDRMVAQTMSVNGDTDREYIKNYIENMRANEAFEYRKYISSNVPGVNLNITIPIPESLGGGSFDTFLSIGETIFINV